MRPDLTRSFTSQISLLVLGLVTACGDDSAVSTSATGTDTDTGSSGGASTTGTSNTTVPTTSVGTDNSGSGSATDSATGTTGMTSVTTGPTTGMTTGPMTTGTTGNTSGTTGNPGECAVDADCDAMFGAAPCGMWTCNQQNFACEAASPGCTDVDQDGYGVGMGCMCAGLDCDDNDESVTDTGAVACYSGPMGTDGVGACKAGTAACTAGVIGPCVGEVTPSGEACNNVDDDCDNQTDEDLGNFNCGVGVCAKAVAACVNGQVGQCVAGMGANTDGPTCNGMDDDCDGPVDEDCKQCVLVTPNGNDMTANGTIALPFKTIQAAINYAANNMGPKNVCVAAGPQCGATATYQNQNNQTVTMANGVSVLGRYESTTLTRCNNSTTVIQPGTAAGVTFPASVQTATVLDGFRVDRFQANTTAGVTIDGAKGAVLNDITISNTPGVQNSYGVNVINGAEATITKGRIDAGNGSQSSIGVRSVGSKVKLQNNCASINAQGRCDDFCANNPSIRGRTQQGTGVTYAVLLDNSPNSLVETSAMCATTADQGASLRIVGNGAGIVVRGNLVNAFGGVQDSHGIWMEDCGGAAPWIVDNHYIAAAGTNQMSRVDGVRAVGDCHPVIDSNLTITGGGEGNASNPTGVHCLPNGNSVASKCVVLGNLLIRGSEQGFPPVATGVRCDGASCNRVEDNVITGRGGQTSYGVFLQRTGAFVSGNTIRGGCSGNATGVQLENAFSRVQNNAVLGYSQSDCTNNPPAVQSSVGLRVLVAQGNNEPDVHSNTMDGGGVAGNCTSRGVEFSAQMMAPNGGRGIFRNNILRAGACNTARVNFAELMANADPRVFENNMLDNAGMPTALYLDENNTQINMAAMVDALGDMIVSGTLSGNSMLVNPPTDIHLQNGSPCKDKGTQTGAPKTDIDGANRDAMPDIGADEL